VAAEEWSFDKEGPSFLNHVMPVLSKAGCNMGKCHGNAHGKGGFRLSLRGENPAADYLALVDDVPGRRINRVEPEESLILLKPTTAVPHQGGLRFEPGSVEFETLEQWLAAGAPGPREDDATLASLHVEPAELVLIGPQHEAQLRVTAQFDDGTTRDVTRLAVYETSNLVASVSPDGLVHREEVGETTVLVRFLDRQVPAKFAFVPQREDFAWTDPPVNNYIDGLVWQKLKKLRMLPSALADDRTFVRRAYLDALGLLPAPHEAREFVDDKNPYKRARLIDKLLERPGFADVWALRWSDLLRNEEKVLDPKGVDVFYEWIRESFANGKPLDDFVREIIAAKGSTYQNPPANFWRAVRDPISRGETTAQVFLGARLQCAKCHNHPFDRWTQDDYYSWAALFARIDYEIIKNERKDDLDKHEFNGEQIVLVKDEGEVTNARTGEDARPRFLASNMPALAESAERLEAVSQWLCSRDNRMFARMQANRIWYYIMGRGIVEPIDDFRATNPPANTELLDALTDDFISHGFNVRHLVRTIMNSRVYQLASEPNESNSLDEANFARAVVKRLPAEVLLDAQCQALGAPADFKNYDDGMRAGRIPGVERSQSRRERPETGDRFLTIFGKPQRLLACECERSNETTLAQALVLVGGKGLHERLLAERNRLDDLVGGCLESRKIVEELYWASLTRPPTDVELASCTKLLDNAEDRRAALEDIAWALVNAKEFVFRH
jgi:hypothetical protein